MSAARNYPRYFTTIHRLLKPGRALSASRHRASRQGHRSRIPPQVQREAHAIGRYIFPGGELDHIGMSVSNLERHGFEVHDVEAWREHYARTTRLWHDRLLANFAAAEREVGAVKTRMWLDLSGRGLDRLRSRQIGVFQTLASKRRRGASGVPLSRADLYR